MARSGGRCCPRSSSSSSSSTLGARVEAGGASRIGLRLPPLSHPRLAAPLLCCLLLCTDGASAQSPTKTFTLSATASATSSATESLSVSATASASASASASATITPPTTTLTAVVPPTATATGADANDTAASLTASAGDDGGGGGGGGRNGTATPSPTATVTPEERGFIDDDDDASTATWAVPLVIIIVLLLLVGGGALYFWWRRRAPQSRDDDAGGLGAGGAFGRGAGHVAVSQADLSIPLVSNRAGSGSGGPAAAAAAPVTTPYATRHQDSVFESVSADTLVAAQAPAVATGSLGGGGGGGGPASPLNAGGGSIGGTPLAAPAGLPPQHPSSRGGSGNGSFQADTTVEAEERLPEIDVMAGSTSQNLHQHHHSPGGGHDGQSSFAVSPQSMLGSPPSVGVLHAVRRTNAAGALRAEEAPQHPSQQLLQPGSSGGGSGQAAVLDTETGVIVGIVSTAPVGGFAGVSPLPGAASGTPAEAATVSAASLLGSPAAGGSTPNVLLPQAERVPFERPPSEVLRALHIEDASPAEAIQEMEKHAYDSGSLEARMDLVKAKQAENERLDKILELARVGYNVDCLL